MSPASLVAGCTGQPGHAPRRSVLLHRGSVVAAARLTLAVPGARRRTASPGPPGAGPVCPLPTLPRTGL
eukprot:2750177-Alexandrium_andersonii.AAC.1